MTSWTQHELDKIGSAEEIQLVTHPKGAGGKTVTVWVVRVSDDIYVRSVKGRISAWFCGAQFHHQGRIRAGGSRER